MRPSFRIAAVAATFAIAAACASAPPPQLYKSPDYMKAKKAQEGGEDPSKIMICEQSMVTGSHISKKHCWSKLEMDVAQERAQRAAGEQRIEDRP